MLTFNTKLNFQDRMFGLKCRFNVFKVDLNPFVLVTFTLTRDMQPFPTKVDVLTLPFLKKFFSQKLVRLIW